MKRQWTSRLLALLLALLLVAPCFAAAEEEDIVVSDIVDDPIAVVGEVEMDLQQDETGPAPEESFAIFAADEVGPTDDAAFESQMAAATAGPNAVSIDTSQGLDFYLGIPVQMAVNMDPVDAQTTLKWKSSKKKVAKIDKNGLLTPRKAGSTKITVTTGNKKKNTVKVKIHKNIVGNLNPKPTKSMLKQYNTSWIYYPKSIERTAGGKYVCKFYMLQNLGRTVKITNFGLKLYMGETLIGETYKKTIKVSSRKNRPKVFTVTFKPKDVSDKTPYLLPQVGVDNIMLVKTTSSRLWYKR